MPEVTARIDDVKLKQTSKGDIYIIVAAGTEYSTFKRDKAEQARELKGQNVTLSYTDKLSPDGRFHNLYYESAIPANGSLPTPTPTFTRESNDEKETRIMRQSAAKVSAHLLPYLDKPDQNPAGITAVAEYFLDYFVNGPRDRTPQAPDFTPVDDIPF